MLKRFFANVLSSFMGAWIALLLFGAVATIVVFSVVGSLGNSEGEKVTSHSILQLNLDSEIVESEPELSLSYATIMNGGPANIQVLRELVERIGEAAVNSRVDALYIKCGGVSAPPATLNALRKAIVEFRKSGKKVIAYGDNYSQADYYVASAADEMYLNRMGAVALTGLSGTTLFYKDLLDKLGVTFQIFKVGTYKSAVEPFILQSMSEPARAQLDTLYSSMWLYMRGKMAESRKLPAERIDTLIGKVVAMRDAKFALENKLVDSLVNERQVEEILARLVDKKREDINYVSPQFLSLQSDVFGGMGSRSEVAVVYATGEIAEDSKDGIDCYKLVPVIEELAEDDDVKAMVLRVNSPGGSVFGSAQIADALAYFQSKDKKLVVSMGDYAASGGYWISCQADKIFADELTITGSIGVFGMLPDAAGLMQKLGVNAETVSTNANGSISIPFAPLNADQSAAMQQGIENIYSQFVKRVADGRKLSESRVRQIAEGRVWSAITAQKIGLVNEFGTLQDAISAAALLAKIPSGYRVGYYPESTSSMVDKLIRMNAVQMQEIATILGPSVSPATVDAIYRILHRSPQQALMPVMTFNY